MKDIVLTVLITVALVAGFSTHGSLVESETTPKGYGTQIQGDAGMVIPGDGTEPVMATIPPESEPIAETQTTESESESEPIAPDMQINIIPKKEETNMTDIIVAFWHGVAGVLLGEAAAILIALALAKVKKGG